MLDTCFYVAMEESHGHLGNYYIIPTEFWFVCLFICFGQRYHIEDIQGPGGGGG